MSPYLQSDELCSRTESNYYLLYRLEPTGTPKGSNRPTSGLQKEPSLKPLDRRNHFSFKHSNVDDTSWDRLANASGGSVGIGFTDVH